MEYDDTARDAFDYHCRRASQSQQSQQLGRVNEPAALPRGLTSFADGGAGAEGEGGMYGRADELNAGFAYRQR